MKDIRSRISWRRLIYLLPIIMPVMTAVFGLVAVIFLLLDQFKTEYVLIFGLLAALPAGFFIYKKFPVEEIKKPALAASIFVLVFTMAWSVFNAYYSSQHVYTNRDPGVYAEAGIWLMDHDRIQIPKTNVFAGEHKKLTEETSGFGASTVNRNEIYSQGAHLLPAFLGLAGRIGGTALLFKASPLISGVALLALFGLARQLVKNRWAIIATVAFACSLPVIYFSRDTYSEMLAATFTLSSLSLLIAAAKAQKLSLWIIAGMVTGAGVLTRVDAFLSMAGMIVAVLVYLLVAARKERKAAAVHSAAFLFAAALVSAVGILDLRILSSGYFRDLSHNIKLELIGIGALLLVSACIVVIAWRSKLLAKLDAATAKWRGKAAALLVILLSLGLASRPLWMVSKHAVAHHVRPYIEALQAMAGEPIDGARDYAEQTVNWICWYIGPVLTVAAIVGLSIVAYQAMKSKNIKWIAFLGVVFGTALVYLNNPSITPDQIWASRRLLPVILPGVAILGVLGLEWIEGRRKLPFKMDPKVTVAVLATLSIVGPLAISSPFLQTRTYVPELKQAKAVCKALPAKTAILWTGVAGQMQLEATRNFCGVPTASIHVVSVSKSTLSKVAKDLTKKGYVPIVGSYEPDLDQIETDTSKMTLVSSIVYPEYNTTFSKPPSQVIMTATTIYIGRLSPDGSIQPLNK